MAKKPNILARFWQELKRRKVFNVLAMYAGSAFIIIQVESSLADPLNLPRWVGTIIVIVLSAGFPVTAILSWIFDLTPQGIKKTESFEESGGKEIVTPPGRRRLKASDVVMVVMAIAIIILAWPKIFKSDSLKRLRSSGEKISLAIFPFQNLTNDTIWNVYKEGIQQSFISALSNAGELKIRQKETTNKLLQTGTRAEFASISPSIAAAISKKLDADIYIYGNIQKAGSSVRLNAQLIDTKTNDVLKSIEQSGPYNDEKISEITDSLRKKVTDFLLVSKLIKENPWMQHITPTASPDALKYLVYGNNAAGKGDFPTALSWYFKALAVDSSFYEAANCIEHTYGDAGDQEQSRHWLIKNFEKREHMTPVDRAYCSWAYAYSFESPEEQIKYLLQCQEIDDGERGYPYLLGLTYNAIGQYDKAIPELKKSLEISRKLGKEQLGGNPAYPVLGETYHKTVQFKKEKEVYKEAEKYDSDFKWVIYRQAILELDEKDTIAAKRYIEKIRSVMKNSFSSEADIIAQIGWIYGEGGIPDKAEEYFRRALLLDPKNPGLLNQFSGFLINKNRNLDEVQEFMDKAMKLAPTKTDYFDYLNTKGWALYKQGKNKEAFEILQECWDEAPFKLYSIRSHLEEVRKAVDGQK